MCACGSGIDLAPDMSSTFRFCPRFFSSVSFSCLIPSELLVWSLLSHNSSIFCPLFLSVLFIFSFIRIVLFLRFCFFICKNEEVSGNRKWWRQTGSGGGKQGRGNQPPIDDTEPIRKFSIDPRSHTDLQNPAEFSPKGKPIRNFSIDPTSSIRTQLRTPFLRTPFSRLLK